MPIDIGTLKRYLENYKNNPTYFNRKSFMDYLLFIENVICCFEKHPGLTGLNFDKINLSNSKFRESKLDNSTMCETDLTGVDFTHASLIDVKFDGAILIRATITEAQIEWAQLMQAKWIDGINATDEKNKLVITVAEEKRKHNESLDAVRNFVAIELIRQDKATLLGNAQKEKDVEKLLALTSLDTSESASTKKTNYMEPSEHKTAEKPPEQKSCIDSNKPKSSKKHKKHKKSAKATPPTTVGIGKAGFGKKSKKNKVNIEQTDTKYESNFNGPMFIVPLVSQPSVNQSLTGHDIIESEKPGTETTDSAETSVAVVPPSPQGLGTASAQLPDKQMVMMLMKSLPQVLKGPHTEESQLQTTDARAAPPEDSSSSPKGGRR